MTILPDFTVDTCGLLIGLASAPAEPLDKNSELTREAEFFNAHISEVLFRRYKKDRIKYTIKDKNEAAKLQYKPIGYKTFGDNNLMFFALFDDFAYPNRVFHPFHGRAEDDPKYQSYDYQIVVGLNTMREGAANNPRLATIYGEIADGKYPFTCVTRFKVNPLLLCGNGLYYTELIKAKIYDTYSRSGMLVIVLNGVGSDELIMVSFADSLTKIAKKVAVIRNLQFSDLKQTEQDRKDDKQEEIRDWYEHVLNSSFAWQSDPKREKIESAHVFSSSYSLSGYAMERSDKNGLPADDCRITFHWTIKPGHIATFMHNLKDCAQELGITLSDNRLYINDTTVILTLDHKNGLCGKSADYFHRLDRLRSLDISRHDIRQLHIAVSATSKSSKDATEIDGNPIREVNTELHPNTEQAFQQYAYGHDSLTKLRATLDSSKISKVVKERIMKMYHNYNDCVRDPAFVVSFISFRPFLDYVAKVIAEYVDGKAPYSTEEIHEWLDSSARDFESAYLNRFHQSNRMRTLSDFNLEWNGGIQQLIAAMDYAYKLLMKSCNHKPYNKFMYVSGHERVHVTDRSYRINMQHLTYPELFASTIWKEQFNLLLDSATRGSDSELSLRTLRSSGFIDLLKKRLSRHNRFNAANPTHQTFIDRLDREYMTSIIADSLAFHYGYNENHEQFIYWYCRYLLQTPVLHNPDGTINNDRFVLFFSRIMFVYKLNNDIIPSGTLERLRFNPFDPSIASIWISTFEDVATMTDILLEALQVYDFHRTINGMAIRLLTLTYPQTAAAVADMFKSETVNIRTQAIIDTITTIRKQSFEDIKNLFDSNTIPIAKCPEENMIVGNFIPAFLTYLTALDNAGSKDAASLCRMLPRGKDGKPELPEEDSEDAGCLGNILTDPLGGTFCINGSIQSKYFTARSIFHLMLFHFYNRNITNLIQPHDNGNS